MGLRARQTVFSQLQPLSLRLKYTRVIAAYTATEDDQVISANGGVTVTLPPASTMPNKVFWIKRFPGTGGNVTVTCSVANSIENNGGGFVTSVTLTNIPLGYISNGTQWEAITK